MGTGIQKQGRKFRLFALYQSGKIFCQQEIEKHGLAPRLAERPKQFFDKPEIATRRNQYDGCQAQIKSRLSRNLAARIIINRLRHGLRQSAREKTAVSRRICLWVGNKKCRFLKTIDGIHGGQITDRISALLYFLE